MLTAFLAVVSIALGDGLPVKSPAAVGMSAERLRSIDRVVTRGLTAGGYPGAAVVVGRKGAAVWQKGFGRIDWRTNSARVSSQTMYDLASLTKVVGTTTAVMILFDEGKIALDSTVTSYLPEFTGGARSNITIRQLLTHRSGLPASRDLWRIARTPEEANRAVLESPLVCAPERCFIYSDLGAHVLAMVVERVSAERLDVFLDRRVFQPLGMSNTFFRPADSLRLLIAPTEVAPPRGYPLRGEVHDENAYVLGGVAGHAGLFSTAADLSIFAQMMLNGGEYSGVRVVSDSTVALFTRRASGSRALGWAMAEGTSGSGEHLSAEAYGHTGFTGTSLWIDPARDMFVILLTNRVHAARVRRPAKVIADVRADLSDAAALAVMDMPDQLLAMPRSFRADRADGWNRSSRVARSRRGKARRGRGTARGSRNATVKKRSTSASRGSASR
ncbi:MAG: serine hydrolase domain-containing protein [Gemmatimonadaceae bacterium]